MLEHRKVSGHARILIRTFDAAVSAERGECALVSPSMGLGGGFGVPPDVSAYACGRLRVWASTACCIAGSSRGQQLGSFCVASATSSGCSASRLAASSGAKNSSSSCRTIARSRASSSRPASVMLTTWRRRSWGSRCRATRPRASSESSSATSRLGIDRQRVGDRRLRLAGALAEDRQQAVVVELEAGLLGSARSPGP